MRVKEEFYFLSAGIGFCMLFFFRIGLFHFLWEKDFSQNGLNTKTSTMLQSGFQKIILNFIFTKMKMKKNKRG